MNAKWSKRAVVSLFSAALLLGTTATNAAAKGNPSALPGLSPDSPQSVASELESSVSGLTGFGSVALTADQRGVILYWAGSVPSAALADVNALRTKTSVSVAIVPSKYSRAQLYAERDRLVAQGAGSGPVIYQVGPAADDSELLVVVARGSTASAVAAGTTISAEVGARLSAEISEGDAPIPASGRADDVSPFWGGAEIRDVDTQAECTSGFRVHAGSTYYMVTAWHCSDGNPDTFTTYPGAGVVVGSITRTNHPHDVALLSGASYGDSIYTGPYNTASATAVTGSSTSGVNSFVCMEGSFSGDVCNNKVTLVGQSVNYGGALGTVSNLTVTVNQSGIASAGEGDSGGPVVVATSKGQITGMIDGLNPPFIACSGLNDGRACSKTVYIQPVAAIDSDFGVAVG